MLCEKQVCKRAVIISIILGRLRISFAMASTPARGKRRRERQTHRHRQIEGLGDLEETTAQALTSACHADLLGEWQTVALDHSSFHGDVIRSIKLPHCDRNVISDTVFPHQHSLVCKCHHVTISSQLN